MAASAPVVHIGENSPEQVAFKLMHEIANIEKKSMNHQPSAGWTIADRTWILRMPENHEGLLSLRAWGDAATQDASLIFF